MQGAGLSLWMRTSGEFIVSHQSSRPLLGYKNMIYKVSNSINRQSETLSGKKKKKKTANVQSLIKTLAMLTKTRGKLILHHQENL